MAFRDFKRGAAGTLALYRLGVRVSSGPMVAVKLAVELPRLGGGAAAGAEPLHPHDRGRARQRDRQHVPDRDALGRGVRPLAVDPHKAFVDQLCRERPAFHEAGEPEPLVEPLAAFAHHRLRTWLRLPSALVAVAALELRLEGEKLGERRVGVGWLVAALLTAARLLAVVVARFGTALLARRAAPLVRTPRSAALAGRGLLPSFARALGAALLGLRRVGGSAVTPLRSSGLGPRLAPGALPSARA